MASCDTATPTLTLNHVAHKWKIHLSTNLSIYLPICTNLFICIYKYTYRPETSPHILSFGNVQQQRLPSNRLPGGKKQQWHYVWLKDP